ncbi:hypothetical protein CDG76_15405 [Nostoc sp. 'Peltigera membranacea cyanobiont' 210A]|nr:hypothetical protein CDG76_15405 [Nostoc sp. 'Peltigera membranacea cyanobiont' 210A]
MLSRFGVFRKQNKLLLTQTPVCFLILVFSASKMSFDFLKISFCFLKPQFAYSFWCFPQAKAAFTYSNPSLLTYLSNSRIHFGISLSRKLAML